MKHYIIVKFKNDFKYLDCIDDIESIFNQTLDIKGINRVKIKKSNSKRENRYDLMIEIDMERDALSAYDISAPHIMWKEKYGSLIDKKAIFDCD